MLDDGSESGLCCDNVDRGDICEAPPGHNHNPLQLDSAAARLQLPRLRSALDLPPACGAQPLHDHGGTQRQGELVWRGETVCAMIELPLRKAVGGTEQDVYEDDIFVILEDGTTLALHVTLPINHVDFDANASPE